MSLFIPFSFCATYCTLSGKIESVTRPSGITDDIYQVNPIRYKGYYYDSDSGWYNLKTRYYDPVIARFINADDVSLIMSSPQAFTDKNLYAYCDNDPINRSDDNGEFWHIVVGAAIGAAIEAVSQMIEYGHIENGWAIGVAALSGAATAVAGPLAGSAISGVSTFATEKIKGKSLTEATCSATFSAVSGGIMGKSVKQIVGSTVKNADEMIPKTKIWVRAKNWVKRNTKKNPHRTSAIMLTSVLSGAGNAAFTRVSSSYSKRFKSYYRYYWRR